MQKNPYENLGEWKEEYQEAFQQEANDETAKFIATLSPEEQAKFQAVHQAVKILLDAKILFYLFPYLPCTNKGKNRVWQWNSLITFAKHVAKGFVTPESREENELFNASFFEYLFNLYGKGESVTERLQSLVNRFVGSLQKIRDYFTDKKNEL